jgi:diguanylate cyclase (GGDEF)-like protein
MMVMNILVVDSVHFDRERTVRALKNTQHVILKAVSNEDALEHLKNSSVDVILIGCLHKDCAGMSLLYEIRMLTPQVNVPIIMLSRSEDESLISTCLKAGAQDLIFKSEISEKRLWLALLNARTRYELERQQDSTFKKLKYLSETDALTGLSNRYYFESSLTRAVANAARGRYRLELMIIDLDDFKVINDTYGHDVGDDFIRQVTQRIQSCLRDGEVLARLGGDEFGLILNTEKGKHSAARVATRILAQLEEPIKLPVRVKEKVSASIGISVFPDDATTPDLLIKQADVAMYRAKRQGKHKFSYYRPEQQQKTTARVEMENALKSAIMDGSLQLYYQPVMRSGAEKVWGMEALIRWKRNNVLMLPDTFIEVAEETRLIRPIGNWVIAKALQTLAAWHEDESMPMVKMAINLSARQLEDMHLVDFIQSTLSKHDLPGELVEFEITETMLLDHSSRNIRQLESLKALGCTIAIDDFGTGFASISHLRRFPIDVVKIDRSLLPANTKDVKNYSLCEGISNMVHSLGLQAVAEGIETEDHLRCCELLKVDRLQGFRFSAPVSEKNVPLFLKNYSVGSSSTANTDLV